ncbi:MAG: hypothetical protein ACT4O1_12740 [Gemmatimonadota bacterium]
MLLTTSMFTGSARVAALVASGGITLDDPAIVVIATYFSQAGRFLTEWQQLIVEEAELNSQLGRARFDVHDGGS